MSRLKITEAKIESKIVAFCKKNGLYCRKFTSPSQRGVPDRIIAKNGQVMFLELKSAGNTPTPLQLREITTLGHFGMHATWVDNYASAVSAVVKFFKLPTLPGPKLVYGGKLNEHKAQAKAAEILPVRAEDMI